MKCKITFVLFFLLVICITGFSQQDSSKPAGKKGWKVGALPVVAYDADLGFQYGVLGQLNDFGDGSIYPDYRHMIYVEWSRFTKGTGVNQIFYDTKTLLPKHIRMTVDLSYLTEKAVDFFGFNGYEVAYIRDFEDDDSPDYISRVYYKHERKQLRALLDFQGRITSQRFRWLGGISYYNFKVATVDIDNLNKGKAEDKKLPDSTMLLYDKYVDWQLIDQNEKDGGQTIFLKGGLIYDTRDNEPAPNKGVWEEVIIMTAPSFIGNSEFAFTRLAVTHRHYIPLMKDKMTLAYRLAYQGTIGGKAPFYIEPLLLSSFSTATNNDGLGGAKSLRGIKRNRIVGDGTVMANVELRYKIIKTTLLKQNFYIAAIAFGDAGQVVQYRDIDKSNMTATEISNFFPKSHDNIHFGYGAGLRLVLNDNFIVAIDYGFASDLRDGTSGLYINIGNLF